MECFALFYIAKVLNKSAACLLSVSDSNCKKENLTSEQRTFAFNNMILLSLESAKKI